MPDTVTDVKEIDFGIAQPAAEMVVAQAQPAQEVATVPNGAMSTLIERMARDPAVNIDKLERLIAMQERMEAKRAQADFDNAMTGAQEEMRAIRTDKENTQTHSRYATYAMLDQAVRPIYSRHGFALSFNTGDAPRPEELRVLCTVSHRGGHRQEYKIDMPADGKGARGNDVMTRTHATGAAGQYGQRYLLKFIFNLAVGDLDDDGNGAGDGVDEDIERLAGPNALRDPATGRLRSGYDVTKVKKAQDFADSAIEYINLSNAQAAKEWKREHYRVQPGKKKSALQWLEDNSPGQFVRLNTAYLNVTGEELKE